MAELHLGAVEERFAMIVWKNAPISSGELVKFAQVELGWKKSTTYTVLKKLCERGFFENTSGTVRAKISKSEFDSIRCESFIDNAFSGSLPAFIASFASRKKLSDKEIAEIEKMIEDFKGE